jgi:hypothetical protein
MHRAVKPTSFQVSDFGPESRRNAHKASQQWTCEHTASSACDSLCVHASDAITLYVCGSMVAVLVLLLLALSRQLQHTSPP